MSQLQGGVGQEKGLLFPDQTQFMFRIPALVSCVGPTNVGKSWFVARCLRDRKYLIDQPPDIILYVYNIYQEKLFEQIKQWCPGMVTFLHGLDELKKIKFSPDVRTAIVLDDVQQSLSDSKDFGYELISCMMHHHNLLIFYICQTLYLKSRHNTAINRQSSYVVMFRNKRNIYEAQALGRECLQLKPREIQWLYKDISQYNARPYILIDCKPETPDYRQITTNILATDWPKIFYYICEDNDGKL
jgi:hypothetical protein